MGEMLSFDLTINGFPGQTLWSAETVDQLLRPMVDDWTRKSQGRRYIIFLAAPPGSGKSTLAGLMERLNPSVQALGMDGFHYPASYIQTHLIDGQPMSRRKGSPESFDLEQLSRSLHALRSGAEVRWPVYDRRIHDVSRETLAVQGPILLVEGNWLLLREPGWRELAGCCDEALCLLAEEPLLHRRLTARKMRGGASAVEAEAHYAACDHPNIVRFACHSDCPRALFTARDGVLETLNEPGAQQLLARLARF